MYQRKVHEKIMGLIELLDNYMFHKKCLELSSRQLNMEVLKTFLLEGKVIELHKNMKKALIKLVQNLLAETVNTIVKMRIRKINRFKAFYMGNNSKSVITITSIAKIVQKKKNLTLLNFKPKRLNLWYYKNQK